MPGCAASARTAIFSSSEYRRRRWMLDRTSIRSGVLGIGVSLGVSLGPRYATMSGSNGGRSSTMNGDYICLAGYAATDGAWQDLSSEWLALVKTHRLPNTHLHTTDFLAAKSERYKSLDLCPEQRVAVLREFISLINKYLDYGVIIGLDAKELKEITKEWPPEARLNKHEFCLARAVRHLQEFRPLSGNTLGIICDHTDSASHMLGAYRMLKKRHAEFRDVLTFIAFGDDRLMQPLQAADLLACTAVNEWIRTRINQKGNPLLPPLEDLLAVPEGSRITYTAELWDRENLQRQAASMLNAAVNSYAAKKEKAS